MSEDHPLQVARCTKIIQDDKESEKSKYVINVKQIAKFVVKLGERVSPTDIEEGMRVGFVKPSIVDWTGTDGTPQRRPEQIRNPSPPSSQDRPLRNYDDR